MVGLKSMVSAPIKRKETRRRDTNDVLNGEKYHPL